MEVRANKVSLRFKLESETLMESWCDEAQYRES